MSEKNNDFVVAPFYIPKQRVFHVGHNKSGAHRQLKIPCIRFSGRWLENLGFKVDAPYKVIVNDDFSLTLVLVDQDKPEE